MMAEFIDACGEAAGPAAASTTSQPTAVCQDQEPSTCKICDHSLCAFHQLGNGYSDVLNPADQPCFDTISVVASRCCSNDSGYGTEYPAVPSMIDLKEIYAS